MSSWILEGDEKATVVVDGQERRVHTAYDAGRVQVAVDGYALMHSKQFKLIKDGVGEEGWGECKVREGVRVWTKVRPMLQFKAAIRVERDASVAYSTLLNTSYRLEWDTTLMSSRRIGVLSHNNDLLYFKTNLPAQDGSADFVVQRAWAALPQHEYVLVHHSVPHPDYPTTPDRGHVYGFGYLVTPCADDPEACVVRSYTQVDSGLFSSTPAELADLCGENLLSLREGVLAYPQNLPIVTGPLLRQADVCDVATLVRNILDEETEGRDMLLKEHDLELPACLDIPRSGSKEVLSSSPGLTDPSSPSELHSSCSTPVGMLIHGNQIAPKECKRCLQPFHATRRRHCCRSCGDSFCSACSPNKALLHDGEGVQRPSRVCDACHRQLSPNTNLILSPKAVGRLSSTSFLRRQDSNNFELQRALAKVKELEEQLNEIKDCHEKHADQIQVGRMATAMEEERAVSRRRDFIAGKHHTKACQICGAAFRLFRREHHCRMCYRSVCATCSPSRVGKEALRKCLWCDMAPPANMPACAVGHTAAMRAAEYLTAAEILWQASEEERPLTPIASDHDDNSSFAPSDMPTPDPKVSVNFFANS